jgi:hypothetical protein
MLKNMIRVNSIGSASKKTFRPATLGCVFTIRLLFKVFKSCSSTAWMYQQFYLA